VFGEDGALARADHGRGHEGSQLGDVAGPGSAGQDGAGRRADLLGALAELDRDGVDELGQIFDSRVQTWDFDVSGGQRPA
jgi:hypothetical protein